MLYRTSSWVPQPYAGARKRGMERPELLVYMYVTNFHSSLQLGFVSTCRRVLRRTPGTNMRSHILQFGSNFSPLLTIYCISILIVIYGILKIIHITYILQGALNISLRHPRVYFETYTGRKCKMTCITIRIRVDLLCILRHSLATNARSQLIQYSSNTRQITLTLSKTKTVPKPDLFPLNRTLLMHIIDFRSDIGPRSGKTDPFDVTGFSACTINLT